VINAPGTPELSEKIPNLELTTVGDVAPNIPADMLATLNGFVVVKPTADLAELVWFWDAVPTLEASSPFGPRFDRATTTPACALTLLTIAKAAIAKIRNSFI
jgi:hypothetical protein